MHNLIENTCIQCKEQALLGIDRLFYYWVYFRHACILMNGTVIDYWRIIGSDCLCSRSLERRLQRPLLAKSRTLPSIPQSPAAVRLQQSENVCKRQQRPRVPSSAGGLEACTLPPAGTVCVFKLCQKNILYWTFAVN